jgi:hypothetical protein
MIFAVIVTPVLPGVISCRHGPDDYSNPKEYLTEPIVIDGRKDAAWDSGAALKAAGNMTTPSGNDLATLYVTNDTDNLYIALEFGDLSDFWINDRLVLIIDKVNDSSGYSGGASIDSSSWQLAADTMTFTNGQADIYFFHNPGQTDTGASVLHVGGSVLEADWAGNPAKVTASSYHWDNPSCPSFLEYSFALSDLNIAKDDVIRIFAVVSNYWRDKTIHATDIVPEITPLNNQNVAFDFDSALSYTF